MSDTSHKPRILIVTGVLWVGGGAERVAATLGNELTDRGYETHLLTFYEAPEKYAYHGIYHSFNEPIKKSRLAKIARIPVRVWQISRYARAHRIDLAISFLEEANFYTLLAKLCFVWRLPVVVSVRNNIREREWVFRAATRLLYPHARRVVCVTRAIEAMLRDDLHLANTTTIYNPVDREAIDTLAREQIPEHFSWLGIHSPIFVHIGRHTKQKGQWHLLRAFQQVVREAPYAKLLMLGDGEDRWKIENFITSAELGEKVYLFGKQRNVFPYLAAAHCSVTTSLWEGMPNTVLESLAVGVPIVSTDCQTGPREILAPELALDEVPAYPYHTPYGILTAPLSHEECYEHIDEVPLDEAERQLAEAMLAAAQGRYDKEKRQERIASFALDAIIDRWEEVIEDEK